jgi:hypothetical protein
LIFGTFLTLIFIPLVYNTVVKDPTETEEKESLFMRLLKSTKMTSSLNKAKTSKP